MVSTWFAEVRPVADAVMVGVPVLLSRYLKLAVLLPEAMVTLVIVVVSPVSRKIPPVEVVLRVTSFPPTPALTAVPNWSRN